MAAFEVDTFVRVLAHDKNYGKLGLITSRCMDVSLPPHYVWVEMAAPGPFGGTYFECYREGALCAVTQPGQSAGVPLTAQREAGQQGRATLQS